MNKFKKSQELFDEELKYLPGGTTSNARLWHNVCPTDMPCAIFAKKAKGAYLWDVDNNKYIDYRLGYGPIILGHAYPKVLNAVKKVMKDGEVFALNNELELKLAKKINKAVKCAEMIRYANSGTEATMTAVRVARAFTKKDKILKFEGHYHGHHDYVLFSLAKHIKSDLGKKPINASLGIPNSIRNLVFAEEWNDFDNVEKTIKRHHKEIACIICEPVTGNSAVIPPEPGFLNHLRELCNKYNIVLIFDEVKTGFRLSLGGAQEIYNVKPDLATFAKALGNGFPIALVAGKKEIMELIGTGRDHVIHGGTYSGNPISMAAANSVIDELQRKEVFESMDIYGRKLMKGMREIYDDNDVDGIVQGFPTMFQTMFTRRDKITNCRAGKSCDFNYFALLQGELARNGIMIDEDPEEAIYISYSHKQHDLNKTLQIFENAVKKIKKVKKTLITLK